MFNVTNREIGMLVAGYAIGATAYAVVSYFCEDHEAEQAEYQELLDQIEQKKRIIEIADDTYQTNAKEYEDRLKYLEDKIDECDNIYTSFMDDIDDIKKNKADLLEEVRKAEDDPLEYEETEAEEDSETHDNFLSEMFRTHGIQRFPNGRVSLETGWDRVDGFLTESEVRPLEETESEEEFKSEFLSLLQARFHDTQNDEELSYLISAEDHKKAPDFFDTDTLDYYRDDDMIARGRELLRNPDDYINMTVLNHFNDPNVTDEPNIVWCRNDYFETDYEIVLHDDSYQHAVFGVPKDQIYQNEHRVNESMAREGE